jgi:type IV secretory pathway TraG/TraD family ATPase VirD4
MNNYDLDMPLFELAGPSGRGIYTARMAVEGIAIIGANGSGKSSGSGHLIGLKLLSAGWGGLILTVKEDETQLWMDRCRMAGREQDLLIIEPGGKHAFNFLEYISSKESGGISLTDNIVDVLKTVIEAGQEKGGSKDEKFWVNAQDMLMGAIIDLCKLAYGRVTVANMYDIVQTIPKSEEAFLSETASAKPKAFTKAFQAARNNVNAQVERWTASLSLEEQESMSDDEIFHVELVEAIPDARLLKHLDQFFFDFFIPLSDKTRSVVDFSFAAFLAPLVRDPVYSLFCHRPSTVTPEDSLRGKIILINLPVMDYNKVGTDCQIMFKYIWQKSMEKFHSNPNRVPVFLWADECQMLLHPKDSAFQATARSSRVVTVYLTQNLANLHASMGGEKSEYRVKSFLGTLGTKIFHANNDADTNEYASKLIGDFYIVDETETVTVASNFSQSRGKSLKLERAVRPEEFVSLKTGGPRNDFRVDAYIHRQGDSIFNGLNYIKSRFNQKYQLPQSSNHP